MWAAQVSDHVGKDIVGHRENPDQDQDQDQDQDRDEEQYQDAKSDLDPESDLVCLDQEPCDHRDTVSDTPLSGGREYYSVAYSYSIHIDQFVS